MQGGQAVSATSSGRFLVVNDRVYLDNVLILTAKDHDTAEGVAAALDFSGVPALQMPDVAMAKILKVLI